MMQPLANFKKALEAAKRGNDKIAIARSLNNVAYTMIHLAIERFCMQSMLNRL